MTAKKYVKHLFKVTDRFIIFFFWYMPELEIRLADGSELNFDQTFLQFNAKKKYLRRVVLVLNLNAEY